MVDGLPRRGWWEDRFSHLEWEALGLPAVVNDLKERGHLPAEARIVNLKRDENYCLAATWSGVSEQPPNEAKTDWQRQWDWAETFDLEGKADGVPTTLQKCVEASRSIGDLANSSHGLLDLSGALVVDSVVQTYSEKESTCRVDWFLNGPNDRLIFPRATKRRFDWTFNREREGLDNSSVQMAPPVPPGRSSLDWFLVDAGSFKCALFRVQDGYGPAWGRPVGIEYRSAWGGIPDTETRRKVQEFLSFLMGRQMLQVGHSTYTKEGWAVEQGAMNPWWQNQTRSACARTAMNPVLVHPNLAGARQLEKICADLLPVYLEKAESDGLAQALDYVWWARMVPNGPDITLYHAAVEHLTGKALKGDGKKVYLPKPDFDARFSTVKETIEKAFEGIAGDTKANPHHRSQIVGKMEHAFEKGAAQILKEGFAALALPIGTAEKKLFGSRHPFAHGRGTITSADEEKRVVAQRAYETIINRVMLKVMRYEGEYLDLTTQAFETRPLENGLAGID